MKKKRSKINLVASLGKVLQQVLSNGGIDTSPLPDHYGFLVILYSPLSPPPPPPPKKKKKKKKKIRHSALSKA